MTPQDTTELTKSLGDETPITGEQSTPQGQKSLTEFLDEIAARANAATPRPWHAFNDGGAGRNRIGVNGPYGCLCVTGSNSPSAETDATFIAAARSDLPALVKVVRRAILSLELTGYEHTLSDMTRILREQTRRAADSVIGGNEKV